MQLNICLHICFTYTYSGMFFFLLYARINLFFYMTSIINHTCSFISFIPIWCTCIHQISFTFVSLDNLNHLCIHSLIHCFSLSFHFVYPYVPSHFKKTYIKYNFSNVSRLFGHGGQSFWTIGKGEFLMPLSNRALSIRGGQLIWFYTACLQPHGYFP